MPFWRLPIWRTTGTQVFRYYMDPLPSDFGQAFRFQKVHPVAGEPDHYDVCLGLGKDHTCECLGFLKWGRCKHLRALLALREHGRLPGVPQKKAG